MRILKLALSLTAYGTVILCLSACSSKDGVTSLQQDKTNWYCTPSPASGEQSSRLSNDEWRCQESAEAYNKLAPKPPSEELASVERPTVDNSSDELPVKDVRAEPFVVTEAKVDDPVVISETKESGAVTQDEDSSVSRHVTQETVSPELPSELSQDLPSDLPPGLPVTSSSNDDSPVISNWVVQLAAYTDEGSAQALVEKLVTSEYVRTQVDGQEFFTVVVLGFNHRYEAESTASLIKNRHSTLMPWIRSGASFREILAQ